MCIFNVTHGKKKRLNYSIYSVSLRGEIIIMNLSKCIYPFFVDGHGVLFSVWSYYE